MAECNHYCYIVSTSDTLLLLRGVEYISITSTASIDELENRILSRPIQRYYEIEGLFFTGFHVVTYIWLVRSVECCTK